MVKDTKTEEKNVKIRPEVVPATVVKSTVACSNLYITVGRDKDGQPIELFINGSKSGGCKTNQDAIGRLVSALLRNNLVDEAIKQLTGLVCPSCQRMKGELPKEERASYPLSCGDAVARAIKKSMEENNTK